MGLDTGALGPRICDRSSRGHPGMGTRVSIHRTACLSDLVRQRPLSASRGETRCDTYRNRHPCTFGAEDSRLETSARRLTRKRTPPARPRRPSASRQPHLHRGPPGDTPEYWPNRGSRNLVPGFEPGCRVQRSWRFRANSRSWLKGKPGSKAQGSSRNTGAGECCAPVSLGGTALRSPS